MPLAPEYYTADMVRALPADGKRYEVVHGELLVTPSPAWIHQRVAGNLYFSLRDYCRRFRLGEVVFSPADISWSEDSLVQPDVFVVAPEESGGADWRSVKSLRLVAEVLSPSTARHDRFQKRKLYQGNGVAVLWLVDPERQIVEVWTPQSTFPAVETERVTWHPAGAPEPLTILLAELFAPA